MTFSPSRKIEASEQVGVRFTFADAVEVAYPALRPGERLVAGKPYVFDQAALNDHLAREAVADAPADLTAMAAVELNSLHMHCLRLGRLDGTAMAVLRRVIAEQSGRGERAAFEGSEQLAQLSTRTA
jgi:hypothetical protein